MSPEPLDSLKGFGTTTAKRSALIPDVPTFEELGVKDFRVGLWNGLLAPAGTPERIVRRVHAANDAVLKPDRAAGDGAAPAQRVEVEGFHHVRHGCCGSGASWPHTTPGPGASL